MSKGQGNTNKKLSHIHNILKKTIFLGINENDPFDLQLSVKITNFNTLFSVITLFLFQIILFFPFPQLVLISLPFQAILFLIFYLNYKRNFLVAKILLSFTVPLAMFLISAAIIERPFLSIKLLIASSVIIPLSIFTSRKEIIFTVISSIFILILLLVWDKFVPLIQIFPTKITLIKHYQVFAVGFLLYGIFSLVAFNNIIYRQVINQMIKLQKEQKVAYDELQKSQHYIKQQNEELNVLNTLLNKQKDLLKQQNEFLTQILETANEPMILVDTAGSIVLLNKKAEDILGIPNSLKEKPPITNVIIPEKDKNTLRYILFERENFANYLLETQIRTGDGTPKFVKLAITSVISQSSQYLFIVIRDIHEMKEKIDQLYNQNLKIQNNLTELMDNLKFAQTVQAKFLPDTDLLDKYFSEWFLWFNPRDYVSGDFYYIKEKENSIVVAVGDCTGHGVSGALLTTLIITFLNEIIDSLEQLSASKILSELRTKLKKSFFNLESAYEGVDIGLIIYNKLEKNIKFAGAFLSLYLVADRKILVINGDRMPVGQYLLEKEFTEHEINAIPGIMLYLASDGFQDQISQDTESRFSKRRLKNLFLEVSDKPAHQQKQIIIEKFYKWKGNEPQMDDVTILGIRI